MGGKAFRESLSVFVLQQAEGLLNAAQKQFGDIQDRLKMALEVLTGCQWAYQAGSDTIRRRMNQALFERILVDMDNSRATATLKLADPFQALVRLRDSKRVDEAAEQASDTQKPATEGRSLLAKGVPLVAGSKELYLVAAGRFELPTKGL